MSGLDTSSPNIIFFDGHCNLCNHFIDFIVRRDKNRKFYIASLQGKSAKKYLSSEEDIGRLSTVVFLDQSGMTYYRSKALFRIFWHMGGIYRACSWLRVLPPFITDFFYKQVASRRYQIFGKQNSCRLPTAGEKAYFLD